MLLVLAVGAAMLPMQISSERDELKQKENDIVKQGGKALEPLNFATQQVAVVQLRQAAQLDLSTTNKVLNPLLWQKSPEGKLIKFSTGEEAGPKALVVTKLVPLHLNISLDGVNTSEATPRYTVSVEREAAADRTKRTKKPYFASLNNKNEVFTVREASGPVDDPVLKLELADGGEIIEVSKAKPFKRVDGYMVDLKYSLESRPPWTAQRVGAALKFGGEDYIIVAITKNEVVVLAKSNQKKTPVPIQL
ncbi:MAG: hypothetical protein QM813_15630 [Verrucomicrobiota bacterium]